MIRRKGIHVGSSPAGVAQHDKIERRWAQGQHTNCPYRVETWAIASGGTSCLAEADKPGWSVCTVWGSQYRDTVPMYLLQGRRAAGRKLWQP